MLYAESASVLFYRLDYSIPLQFIYNQAVGMFCTCQFVSPEQSSLNQSKVLPPPYLVLVL